MSACMCLQAASAGKDHLIEEEHEDDTLCIVCWEELKEVVFYNCGHMVRSLKHLTGAAVMQAHLPVMSSRWCPTIAGSLPL